MDAKTRAEFEKMRAEIKRLNRQIRKDTIHLGADFGVMLTFLLEALREGAMLALPVLGVFAVLWIFGMVKTI